MAGKVEVRCTQCGTDNEAHVSDTEVDHGTDREHGTETLWCSTCQTETVQNRRGKSVPIPNDRSRGSK